MSSFSGDGATAAGSDALGSKEPGHPLRLAFLASLACFALAALTGSLLRYGLLHGFPWELQYLNVRHAHTHLMYFGWVTPALFALIGVAVARRLGRPLPLAFHASVAAALVGGLLAYPPFLMSGYQLTAVGDTRLPLSMMAAGLVVVCWYAWSALYLLVSWRLPRDLAVLALDAAVLTLLVSSSGAWGLAALAFAPFAPPATMDALVRFYLDVFSQGWFVLALLGVLFAALPPFSRSRFDLPALAALFAGLLGAAFAELLAWPHAVAQVSSIVAAGGLLLLAARAAHGAWRAGRAQAMLVSSLLVLKALLDVALLSPAIAAWSERMVLQVFLLHAFLLGVVTLGVMSLALREWLPRSRRLFWWLALAVAALLMSQLPLSGLWPANLRGPWALAVAFWATLPGTAVMLVAALRLIRGALLPVRPTRP